MKSKIILLAILVAGWVLPQLLHAQYISPVTSSNDTSSYDLEFQTDSTLIAKGAFTNSTVYMGSGDTGTGTRMIWYPEKAAFRVGYINTASFSPNTSITAGTEWDLTSTASNIGVYSFAAGNDTVSTGNSAAAFGTEAYASGDYSFAAGRIAAAGAYCAIALGGGTTASGEYSTALGGHTQAEGTGSTAFGYETVASQNYATAGGYNAQANGEYSTALGLNITASAYASTVFGQYNVGGGTSLSWTGTDPLFEIGDGTSTTPSDALLVDQSGNVTVQTSLTVPTVVVTANPAAGDIPMYGH